MPSWVLGVVIQIPGVTARAAGGYGAKLTGAGGGGCMIAICPKHLKSRIVGAIESCEARAFSTASIPKGKEGEGCLNLFC